jgi:mycothiol synthase
MQVQAGLSVRPPAWQDLEPVLELILARDVADLGEPDFTVEDLRSEWQRPRFELPDDAWVVEEPAGGIVVGYGDVWNREGFVAVDVVVRPGWEGRGIGSGLLDLAERRSVVLSSQARPGEPVTIHTYTNASDTAAGRLMEARGYRPARRYWRMSIQMEGPPPEPRWPHGVGLRPFRPGEDDRAVHAAVQEAFHDIEGQPLSPFDEWSAVMMDRANFDPSVWFVAAEGDKVVGVALCYDEPPMGWVRQLAVRLPWRGRGLGLALLHHVFGEFHRRGRSGVELVVDAENSTGALRLYERAGMHSRWGHIRHEKVLPA